MNTADGRTFIQQPGGIATILLLVLLLAFRVHACPMPVEANTAPLDTHNCCPGVAANPDSQVDPGLLSCSDGPCLQALGDHSAFDGYLRSASEPDRSAPVLLTEQQPSARSDQHYSSPPFTLAAGPPPLQRSRVLRL